MSGTDRHPATVELGSERGRPVVAGKTPDTQELLSVLHWLQLQNYRFVTGTPSTHARVLSRGEQEARTLRDIFGWSMPFAPAMLPPAVLDWLQQAGVLERSSELLRSSVRVSSLEDALYVHSAYPTHGAESVFFGPDTYRFAHLIQQVASTLDPAGVKCVVDIGCGTGAGGIHAYNTLGKKPEQLILTDINPLALSYARINAVAGGISHAQFREGDLYAPVHEPIDLILANPPYLLDPTSRVYRHGGGSLGSHLSMRIVAEGLPRLTPNGTLVLYTGAPIVAGRDTLLDAISPSLNAAGVSYDYHEIDPDVFGEELDRPAYSQVERIAVVALVVRLAPRSHCAS